jgi:hypothetical protein
MTLRIYITEATKPFLLGTNLYKILLTSAKWRLESLTLPSVKMFADELSEAHAAVRSTEPSSSRLVCCLILNDPIHTIHAIYTIRAIHTINVIHTIHKIHAFYTCKLVSQHLFCKFLCWEWVATRIYWCKERQHLKRPSYSWLKRNGNDS